MDDKMTKEVEKVYYVRKMEKLDSEGNKYLKKVLISLILGAGLFFAGLTSEEGGFIVAALVPAVGVITYGTFAIINYIESYNIEKKLEELEKKEKIEEELKGLEETREMEGKTK